MRFTRGEESNKIRWIRLNGASAHPERTVENGFFEGASAVRERWSAERKDHRTCRAWGRSQHTIRLWEKAESFTKVGISINAFYIYARAPPGPNRGVRIDWCSLPKNKARPLNKGLFEVERQVHFYVVKWTSVDTWFTSDSRVRR